jgi:hypothetical protein
MYQIREFIQRNPVRVAAVVSSIVALFLPVFAPDLPVDHAVVFVLAALGLGEYAQRVEDRKTDEAVHTNAALRKSFPRKK